MQGKVLGGGGLNINGIVDEYIVNAGENINASDFVSYVNDLGLGTDTSLSSCSNTGYSISAVLLSEDKVFIAHAYGSSYSLHGTVCTIEGTTITAGADTQLSNSGRNISAVLLSEDKVFIAHNYGNSNYLYGMICTIEGTTITAGADTALNSSSNTGNVISAVLLSEDKVFIAHSSDNYLRGMICTIEGTTITAGTDTYLSGSNTGYSISAVLLSEDKVFIAHAYGSSNRYLYSMICTISDTTITAGTDTQLSNITNSGRNTSAVLLSEDKVFIAHAYDSDYYLYGMICTISDTTITAGTDTQLSSTTYTGYEISAILLDENTVFISHGDENSSTSHLYGTICIITGTSITVVVDTKLSNSQGTGSVISAVLLSPNKVFIAHSNGNTNYYLYGLILNNLNRIRKIQAGDTILGISKTSGTAGQTVKVVRPNI